MYSTLSKQGNLVRAGLSKRLYLNILLSWIFPKSKFYLIVRNPFDRIKSFYKSKFPKAEINRLWMLQNEKGEWQKCTEYFFPYLNLNTDMAPKMISQVLISTSFDKVISILPNVFSKDGHMTPQHYAKKISLSKYGYRCRIPIRFQKVFKIESKKDLNEIEKIFDINLSKPLNSTKNIVEDFTYNDDNVKTIANIYKRDFEEFKYEQTPSGYSII